LIFFLVVIFIWVSWFLKNIEIYQIYKIEVHKDETGRKKLKLVQSFVKNKIISFEEAVKFDHNAVGGNNFFFIPFHHN